MNKLTILGVPVLLCGLFLAGCEEDEGRQPSDEAAKSEKHELVYAEVLNNGGNDYPREVIEYKDGDKTKTYKTSTENVYEHVLKDSKAKPFVVKDDDDYHIFRQPYMVYGDDDVEGDVTNKDEVKSK